MRLLSALLALLSLAFSLPARADNNATTNSTDAQSLRAFVQEFYDWYGANILSGPPGSTWERVRKERKSRFSPQIIRALDENAAAQASVPGDTVGLDFDSFVASQDSDERYEVGKVTKKGEVYFVNVHGVHQGRARAEPTVVAELEGSNGLWRFRNFHYQHGRELLALLKSLQVARGEGTRHPGTRPGDP